MDFLSSAVSAFGIGASAFSKDVPVELDDNYPICWKVWQGTVRKDGQKCTVFEVTDPSAIKYAKNFVSSVKKLRFPGLPKILGAEESASAVTVALERVTPLSASLADLSQTNRVWGLANVLTTLGHLQNAKCVLGNIHLGTVWLNSSGDWVLTGLEVASFSNQGPDLGAAVHLDYQGHVPPEGWTQATNIDTFQFAKFAQAILPNAPAATKRAISQGLSARRPPVSQIDNSAFATPLNALSDNLAQFQMMNEYEFTQLLRDSGNLLGDFSTQFISGRLIPALVQAYGSNQRGGIELIRLVLHLAERADPSDQLTGFIVSLFSSLDRAVRVELLQQISRYIGALPDKAVQRNILPAMAVSFADSEPMMRRESLKSISHLAPKLASRQLNGDLLRLLAKTNNDPEADIRADTIRVLTNLSQFMDKSTRSGVVITALAKSLKDPSPEVRLASLESLVKTADSFGAKECAEKLLGPAASSLLDSRHEVRSLGREILQNLLDKITAESDKLDESLENGAPPPTRTPVRDETPPVSKLFGANPPPEAAPFTVASIPAAPAAKAAPVVPRIDPPKGFVVEENAVFTSSGWDNDWDEPEPTPKPASKPASKLTSKPAPKPAPKPAASTIEPDLEPEDDGEDGWGDDW